MANNIVAAAIRIDDGRIFTVPRPGRHHDVIKEIRASGYTGPVGSWRQGFINEHGVFLSRKEALAVVLTSGELSLEDCHAPRTGLFSEDLW